ncbi:hypothetical protein PR003_g10229 [Phytophthora rubi]|uniref:Kazal-like domain-containing protein n=1 Tax=Phytophthora rubi TaxID=129364 RepID=A0A6A3M730_9STRA|nr:hypothetical protein PR002_g11523 [Phytophthora rubi]KAE9026788.1 hypothetical protein PR001_g12118 [Phytophthora rubi]KAE9340933.1 hypothetical protein PR003_g10229 [Phytophthora rubi]
MRAQRKRCDSRTTRSDQFPIVLTPVKKQPVASTMKFAVAAVLASLLTIGISAEDGSGVCGRDVCPDGSSLVCASNGVTYENQCEFDFDKCVNENSEWTVLHEGMCRRDGTGR